MFEDIQPVRGFSVDNLEAAQNFYSNTSGIEIATSGRGPNLTFVRDSRIFIDHKADQVTGTFTVLKFPVDYIDKSVEELTEKSVKFDHNGYVTDEKRIARSISGNRGPDIAWSKDPAGNILTLLHEV